MKYSNQTDEIIAASGFTEAEIVAAWFRMQFRQAARHGDVPQNEVWHILGLSMELYPEEMLDRLKSHGWL